ncbi:MAG: general secretion pathway protein GspB [Thermomonas sp.]
MSLILEALRKSEAERRRGLAPDVAMELPPTPASPPRTLATWVLPMLVLAALLVLAGWWFTREPVKTVTADVANDTKTAMPPSSDSLPVPAMTPRIEPISATPSVTQAPVAPIAAPISAPSAAPPSKPASESTAQPTPTRPLPSQPATDISNDTSTLPPIKLSMHMWDDAPSKRFVILNGQRMAEGDRYGEITVLAIERAGVVVESNGSKARVPLP